LASVSWLSLGRDVPNEISGVHVELRASSEPLYEIAIEDDGAAMNKRVVAAMYEWQNV
jgi:hypothetical protein